MAGRPKRIFTDKEVSIIERMSRQNELKSNIARKLGITAGNFSRYLKLNTQFKNAYFSDKSKEESIFDAFGIYHYRFRNI